MIVEEIIYFCISVFCFVVVERKVLIPNFETETSDGKRVNINDVAVFLTSSHGFNRGLPFLLRCELPRGQALRLPS
jgi:hypothetical protein